MKYAFHFPVGFLTLLDPISISELAACLGALKTVYPLLAVDALVFFAGEAMDDLVFLAGEDVLRALVFLVALVFLAGADVAGAGVAEATGLVLFDGPGVAEAAALFLFAGPGVAVAVAGLFLAMAGADGADGGGGGGGGGATAPIVALLDEE